MAVRLRMVTAAMLVLSIAALLPRLASAQPGGHPLITSVHADFDLFRLRIVGARFGTEPTVWLSETRLAVESATDTEIYALLGGPIDPGSYLVTVARDDKNKGTAKFLFSAFNVTLGAQGPQGEKGDKGDQGVAGNDGRDGEDGANGNDGKDGASPFRLVGNNAVYTAGNVGAGTEGPSALIQAGPGQDFGQITTIGASQRPQDTVGMSVRSDFRRPTFQFCASGPCNYIQMDRSSTDLWFGDFDNPSMILQPLVRGGNVGVGVRTPSAQLQVGDPQGHPNQFGNITTLGVWQQPNDTVGLSIRKSGGNPTQQFCVFDCNYIEMNGQNHELWFGARGAGVPATMVLQRRDLGGRVGINAPVPTARLQVGDTLGHPNNFGNITTVGVWQQPGDTVALSVRSLPNRNPVQQFCTNDCNYIEMQSQTTNLWFGAAFGNPALAVQRSDLGGSVGVGTANPTAKLHVGELGGFPNHFGNITTFGVFQEPGDTVGLSIRRGNGNPIQQFCDFQDCNYIEMQVGGVALAVNGQVVASAPVFAPQFVQTSARRFKTDIETVSGALDMVGRMRGVTYTAKATGKAEVGVIAEEMYQVLPQVVAVSDGQVQGVEYSRLVAVLIEAVKEQQAQITALRREVTALVAIAAASQK